MTTYSIASTDGSFSIPINAGTVNGPEAGSANIDTDLILYGQGSFNWGQGIEQNLLRIMESFAVDAINPNDPDNQQIPNPEPLGGGTVMFGIKNPVVGQTWFNKSNKRLYVCTAARIPDLGNGIVTEPVWELDGEGRYLSSGGGSINGNLIVDRPTGTGEASITIRANDNASDIFLSLHDIEAQKARIIVEQDEDNDPTTGIDTLRLQKMVGNSILNEIVLRDTFIETRANVGKIRTSSTLSTDDDATLTTKDYVDDNMFGGGTINETISIDTPNAYLQIRSPDETTNAHLLLADLDGNKSRLSLEQISVNPFIDHLVLAKGIFNGPNQTGITNNEIRITDDETQFLSDVRIKRSELTSEPSLIFESSQLTSANIKFMNDAGNLFAAIKTYAPVVGIPSGAISGQLILTTLEDDGSARNELVLDNEFTRTTQNLIVLKDSAGITLEDTEGSTLDLQLNTFTGNDNDSARLRFNNSVNGSSFINFMNDSIVMSNPYAINPVIDFSADGDNKLATKLYVDQSTYREIQTFKAPERVLPNDPSGILRPIRYIINESANVNSWQNGINLEFIDGEFEPVDNIDFVINRPEKHRMSGLESNSASMYTIRLSFDFGFAMRVPNTGNDIGFMPMNFHWVGEGGFLQNIDMVDVPVNTFTPVYMGSYSTTVEIELPTTLTSITIRLGHAGDELRFGPIRNPLAFSNQFNGMLIDDLRIKAIF